MVHLWIKKLFKGTKDTWQATKMLNWPIRITLSRLNVRYGIGWKKSIAWIPISKCKKFDFLTVQGHKMFPLYHFSLFSINISFLWRFILSLYRAKVVCWPYGTINLFMPHFLGFMLSQLSCLLQSWKGSFPVNFTALNSMSHQCSEHCSIERPNKQQVSFMFVTLNKKCQC